MCLMFNNQLRNSLKTVLRFQVTFYVMFVEVPRSVQVANYQDDLQTIYYELLKAAHRRFLSQQIDQPSCLFPCNIQ